MLAARKSSAVSVVISTRDRVALLERCLRSLAAGRVLPAEAVVVDQSRGDESAATVKRLDEELPFRVVYVRHEGLGLGASQNLALRHARHPVVAVTDDDCVPDANWLAVIEETLADEAVAGVTGRVLPLPTSDGALVPVSSRVGESRIDFGSGAAPWNVGSGNNFAVRRSQLLRVGGNDERLGPGSPGRGGVDMDLFYRLLRAGARLRYEPRSIVLHQQVTSQQRLGRRIPYGFGMGACFGIWLREGDLHALRHLGSWVALRFRRFARGIRRGDVKLIREELLVLVGTAGGLVHGTRLRPARRMPLRSAHVESSPSSTE